MRDDWWRSGRSAPDVAALYPGYVLLRDVAGYFRSSFFNTSSS